jgi:hypothetical protein
MFAFFSASLCNRRWWTVNFNWFISFHPLARLGTEEFPTIFTLSRNLKKRRKMLWSYHMSNFLLNNGQDTSDYGRNSCTVPQFKGSI